MKHHLRKVTKMIERIKVCWYVLTKKHYMFFAYDREELHNSGAKCYIEEGADYSRLAWGALFDYAKRRLGI